MTENVQQQLDRLIALDRESDVIFAEFNTKLRSDILKALARKDRAKADELKAKRDEMRASLDEVDQKLEDLLLSSALADDLVARFEGKVNELKGLQDEMAELGRTLENVKKMADLASGLVSALAPIA